MNAIVPARLQVQQTALTETGVTPQQWRVLVDAIFPNARTTDAVLLALEYCKARGLDPFKRPVHIVPMWNSELRREVETVWPGINSICTEAARTGAWAGMDAPAWGPDVTETFSGQKRTKSGTENIEATVTFPEWCSITVYRMIQGQRCPFTETVYWRESYAAIGRSGVPNEMWQKRPHGQLHKCAKAAVLRAAFPECADYAAEEMEGRDIKAGGVVIDHQPDTSEPPKATPTEPPRNLREHAQDMTGQPRDPAPADSGALPLVTPDGVLRAIGKGKSGAPAKVVWVAAWKRAIGMCEDTGALRALRRENGPHLASVSEFHPDAVAEVEDAIEAQMTTLLRGDDAGPDDGWPGPDTLAVREPAMAGGK